MTVSTQSIQVKQGKHYISRLSPLPMIKQKNFQEENKYYETVTKAETLPFTPCSYSYSLNVYMLVINDIRSS